MFVLFNLYSLQKFSSKRRKKKDGGYVCWLIICKVGPMEGDEVKLKGIFLKKMDWIPMIDKNIHLVETRIG